MNFDQQTASSIWETVSEQLTNAATSAQHPLHLFSLATISEEGLPHIRTVVLRKFQPFERIIFFHTDIRSPKTRHIQAHKNVSLHWYSPSERLQIRIAAQAIVHHHNACAENAWLASRPMSRACYTSTHPPGTPIKLFPPAPPVPNETDRSGFNVFAVVACHFETIELLSLHASGHQRVRLHFGNSSPALEILAP